MVSGLSHIGGVRDESFALQQGEILGLFSLVEAAQADEAEGQTDVRLTEPGQRNEMQPYVESGTVAEFALHAPFDLSCLTHSAAAAPVTGEIAGAPGDTFTASRLGSYTVGEGGGGVLGPLHRTRRTIVECYVIPPAASS